MSFSGRIDNATNKFDILIDGCMLFSFVFDKSQYTCSFETITDFFNNNKPLILYDDNHHYLKLTKKQGFYLFSGHIPSNIAFQIPVNENTTNIVQLLLDACPYDDSYDYEPDEEFNGDDRFN